jgi:pyruvate ferredoxin oxidoreductase delta subunit
MINTKDLHEGGIIRDAGNAAGYKTGDWRTFVPKFVAENCIHCMFCWIYCPDSAIEIDASGPKPLM